MFHTILQITVLAKDLGLPEARTGPSARVVVNVIRNKERPTFQGTPYLKNITEAEKTNSVIFTVRAQDRDNIAPYNQITYSIVGDDSAPNYFAVNETSGQVKIRRDIKNDRETDYQVNY